MVESRYSSSTGTAVRPSFTSSAGSTPDSLSKIIHPSVRTVSLTQKGMRQMMNSSEPARPRASLAMIQATGNASSSVRNVASHRHQRRAYEYMPVQGFGEKSPVLGQTVHVLAGADPFAEGQQGKIDVRQYDQSAEPKQRRREQHHTERETCQRETRV